MPTVFQNLFANIAEKRLQSSDSDGTTVIIEPLFKYQSLPLSVVLVERDPNGGIESYERKAVSNLALRVTINDTLDDAAPLVQQASWTADSVNNTMLGLVDLNTAAMTAYIGAAASKQAYIQIEFSESGGGWTPVYQQEITIKNSVTTPTTTSPDPTQQFRNAAESDLIYDTAIMRPGVEKVIISQNQQWQRVLGINNDGTRIDEVHPYTP